MPRRLIPPLRLVRVGLLTDAQIKRAIGWTEGAWALLALGDERVAECYRNRGVSDARRESEIHATASLVWGGGPRGR